MWQYRSLIEGLFRIALTYLETVGFFLAANSLILCESCNLLWFLSCLQMVLFIFMVLTISISSLSSKRVLEGQLDLER